MKKTFLIFTLLALFSLAMAADLINENIQNWTARTSYGNYTQSITAGTVNMIDCIVSPGANASGTGSIGRVQLKASTGILELPALSSCGTTTFNIAAGGAGRTVKLQSYNGTTWIDLTTFSGIGTTGATFSFVVNSSSSTTLRLSAPSAAIYVHDIIVTDYAASTPTISVSSATLSGFTYVYGNGPSTAQDFTVSGTNLTADISIAAPIDYEVSLSSGSGYVSTINLTQTGGSVSTTTIYVRLKDGLSVGDYNNEYITVSSAGATQKTVTCNGSVTSPPPPDAPTATAATSVANTSFTANWNAVSGATGYYLDVYTKTTGGNASDLFISEYIEGSSNNKGIEIYNGTGASVDLSSYSLKQYNNGATTPTYTLDLSGSLTNGSVYRIVNSNQTIFGTNYDLSTNSSVMGLNGNDAVAIFKGADLVDVVGPIGNASDWGKDVTLVRKAAASVPSATYSATDWDSYGTDTITYWGSHDFSGGSTISYVSGYQNLNVNNVTSFNVIGLTPGTTYYYVVWAYNAYGTSGDSNEIEVTTTDTFPQITLSASTLTGFTYIENSGPSGEQNFTVTGSNLTANISIDAPTNYQISTSTGTNFDANMADPITLTHTGGSVSTTTIYVRLKAGLSVGDYNNEVITASSTGATNQTVTCSGSVTAIPDPTLNVSVNSLSEFNYLVGAGPSSSKDFTVSGTYLTNDIVVTAPASYEVSEDNNTFSGSVTLTAAKLDVAETTLYVRLKQGLAVGHYAENLTVSTVGATDETIALSGDVLTDQVPFCHWNFNTNPPTSPDNWIAPIASNSGTGSLTYTFDYATSYTGETLNAAFGDAAGGSFAPVAGTNQVNNGREFVMTVDTSGRENIVMTYATRGTDMGFTTQTIYYSVDGGANFILFDTLTGMNVTTWSVQTMDFSAITGASDNPSFMVKIVVDGATARLGNNRFDNILFFGDANAVTPVVLSSFTCTLTSDMYVSLNWVTQSETGMRGFYVLRGEQNSQQQAQIISPLISATNQSHTQVYSYRDIESLVDGTTYYYWLSMVELDGSSTVHGPVTIFYQSVSTPPVIPTVTALNNVYPNPFNPVAFIPYSIEKGRTDQVRIHVYNSRGQIVRTLIDKPHTEGNYQLQWDGRDANGNECATGVYFVRMIVGKDSFLRKAVLVK